MKYTTITLIRDIIITGLLMIAFNVHWETFLCTSVIFITIDYIISDNTSYEIIKIDMTMTDKQIKDLEKKLPIKKRGRGKLRKDKS